MQARGSPHVHALLWVNSAPKLGIHSMESVIKYIDECCKCSIPDEAEDKQLHDEVIGKQMHNHRETCQKKPMPNSRTIPEDMPQEERDKFIRDARCRFNYPRPASDKTRIVFEFDEEELANLSEDERHQVMQTTNAEVILKRTEEEGINQFYLQPRPEKNV